MPKKIILIGLLLLATLVGAGCSQKNSSWGDISWQSEKLANLEYNFEYTLSYPANQKLDKSDDNSRSVVSLLGYNESDSSFTVAVTATGAVKDAAESMIFAKKEFEKKFPVSSITEEKMVINNREWEVLSVQKLLVSAHGAGEKKNPNAELVPGQMKIFFFDSAPYVYRVTFALADRDREQLASLYEEMLRRLVIIK